ncbi:hypothetical protein J6590_021561 [Homalodisca vitripennis]|nr:hypothetical protein J6590_021561 [Homalodisca vitripennis]
MAEIRPVLIPCTCVNLPGPNCTITLHYYIRVPAPFVCSSSHIARPILTDIDLVEKYEVFMKHSEANTFIAQFLQQIFVSMTNCLSVSSLSLQGLSIYPHDISPGAVYLSTRYLSRGCLSIHTISLQGLSIYPHDISPGAVYLSTRYLSRGCLSIHTISLQGLSIYPHDISPGAVYLSTRYLSRGCLSIHTISLQGLSIYPHDISPGAVYLSTRYLSRGSLSIHTISRKRTIIWTE